MSDRTMWQVNRERHSELLRVAKAHRLVKGDPTEGLGRVERLLMSVGDLLVAAGLRLRARYEPVIQTH